MKGLRGEFDVGVLLRVTDTIKDAVKVAAKAEGISQNSWLVAAVCERLGWEKRPITRVVDYEWSPPENE
jgi:hypothetical protein